MTLDAATVIAYSAGLFALIFLFFLRVIRAVFVEMSVTQSHLLEFAGEQTAQVLLFFGRGTGGGSRVGLGVDHHVAQKARGHGMREPEVRSHSRNHTRQTRDDQIVNVRPSI